MFGRSNDCYATEIHVSINPIVHRLMRKDCSALIEVLPPNKTEDTCNKSALSKAAISITKISSTKFTHCRLTLSASIIATSNQKQPIPSPHANIRIYESVCTYLNASE